MGKIVTTVLAVTACVFLCAAPGQAASKMVITIGHGLTEFSGMHAGWVKFKEELEANSNDFDVQIYPNQQLGGDRELTEGAQLGSVTMTTPTNSPLAAFEKDFFILDVPFLFSDRAEAFAALDGEFGQKLLDKLPKINLVGLGYWENGFRNLTNSRNAVHTPEDVKGLKLRTMENAVHLAFWKILGANPTPMAMGELFTALQQKTVDGQENPFGQIFDNKLYEVQPYITRSQHIYSTYVVVMNKDFWDELTEEQQQVVTAAAKAATTYQRQKAEELDNGAADKLRAAGHEITELTPEQVDAFRKAVAPITEDIKPRVSSDAFKLLTDYLNAR